jgi:hypothetical protein
LEAHRQQAAAEAAERARSQAYYNEATKGGAGAGGASEGGAADGAASHQGSGSKQGPAAGAGNGAVQGHGEQLPAQGQVQRQQGVTEGGAQPAEEPGGGERGEGGEAIGGFTGMYVASVGPSALTSAGSHCSQHANKHAAKHTHCTST